MGEMKCSIVIPVFESYEAVRRQILYMNSLNIPDSFEIIFVDDGSQPPIFGQDKVHIDKPNFQWKYGYRPDFRPFTKACALNAGVGMSEAEWVWIFAIDWMITKEMINFISNSEVDCMIIPLIKFALLDENGKLEVVGKKKHFGSIGLSVMKREEFIELGGYNEKFVGYYPSGDDIEFGMRYKKKYGKQHFTFGPLIYGFPKGDTDVCPDAMEEPEVDALRPNIFYQEGFNKWKKNEYNEFWEDFFDPSIEHPEKGFRKGRMCDE